MVEESVEPAVPGPEGGGVCVIRRKIAFGLFGVVAAPVPNRVFGATERSRYASELITFPSRGRTIRAAVFRPVGHQPGAGLVFMHGSGSIGSRQLRFAQRFAEHGYLVLVPTYLDAAADDGLRAAPVMDAWRNCAVDSIEWLTEQGISRQRTALVGYSLGSYIAVDGALGNSRAAVAIGIAGGWDVYPPRPPARRLPVLIIRAGRDTHVRPAGTERWRRFLEDHNVPVRTRVIRGAGHIMTEQEWGEVSGHALDFLDEQIGGPANGRDPD